MASAPAPAGAPTLPPAMAEVESKGADEILKEMNRLPLFMTSLDDTDGEGGENIHLEALKALAYEGTKAEVAENFRQQGNECARAKQWTDAKEFYDKAIAALHGVGQKPTGKSEEEKEKEKMEAQFDGKAKGERVVDLAEKGEGEAREEPVDEETERRKEREIEEACFVNRALCNLEKKNYRSCISDCASTLRLNPSNLKALYRSTLACLALDKLPEALDACTHGLALDPSNAPLASAKSKIAARQTHLAALEKARRDREARLASEKATLALALKSRNILTRTTDAAPDLEDAEVKLENKLDPSSELSFPAILLYPLHGQSDFIKAFSEREAIGEHLEYIFPLPWDEQGEYTTESVEAYMETVSGGLIKAGKKMALGKILGSGKVEVVDGLVRINVVPREKAAGWVEEFKKRNVRA